MTCFCRANRPLFGPDVRAARCPFVGVERTSRLCVPSPRAIDFRKKLQVDFSYRRLWAPLIGMELVCGRSVHRGFCPNDKDDLVAMLAGNPDDVVSVEPFPTGASS